MSALRYVILALLWTVWCLVHSALISVTVTGYLQRRFGSRFRYYRLVFNGLALTTLIPVVMYTYSIQTQPVFRWEDSLRIVQILLILISFVLFLSGARHYDALQFLGIRQIKGSNACSVLTENCELDATGVLGMIRHPWYVGGMLLVWARDLDRTAIITNMIITAYFIIGALLEERKLSIQFGKTYTSYQNRVSMFFPFKWLQSKIMDHRKE